MHILYLHQYFATPRGHTGTRSYEFARRWVAAGHRVTMITSIAQLTAEDLAGATGRGVLRFCVAGIEVRAIRVRYHQTMGYARRVLAFASFAFRATWQALRTPGVDMVYATSTPLSIAVPALVGRWIRRRRYVFEVRDVWPAIPIALGVIRNRVVIRVLRAFERLIYRNAESVVALSPGMVEDVRQVGPRDLRVVAVPNAGDTDLFRVDLDGTSVRRGMGWHDRLVCMHVGAMGLANGVDAIGRAAVHFKDRDDVVFVLIGEGSERVKLEAVKKSAGLDKLELHPSVPKSELPHYLAAADLCLVTMMNVPILEHNSANKFFDCLSAGKPILLNYGGWQREVLEESGAGLGCRRGCDEEFFARLGTLLEDRNRLKEMGVAARKLAEGRFSRDRSAAQALEELECHRAVSGDDPAAES